MNRGSVEGIVSSLTVPEFLYENALRGLENRRQLCYNRK